MFTNIEIQLAQGQTPPDLLQQTKAAAFEQIQLLSPPFIRNFSLSLVHRSINEIGHNVRTKLVSQTTSTEVSEFTAKTARASLEKIILLAQYLDIPNPSQRALALNEFGASNLAESHRYLASFRVTKSTLQNHQNYTLNSSQ